MQFIFSASGMERVENPKYMIDPLGSLTEDEVFFELIDELSPGVLKINAPFLYVVMPMRLT